MGRAVAPAMMPEPPLLARAEARFVVLQVKVKPNSRVSALTQNDDGTWLAQLNSLPIDGKANAELIALIAEHFACRKSAVDIKSGASGRMKLVRVERASAA